MELTASGIAIVIGLFNLAGLFYVVVSRLSRIESRVEVLWCFQLRRGVTETLTSGMLEHNSPFRISPKIQDKYAVMFEGVRNYYLSHGQELSDSDLAMAIENQFWPEIREMCLAEGIHDGACLMLMMNFVRPDARFFREWDEAQESEKRFH